MTHRSWCFRLLELYGTRLPHHRGKWWIHHHLRRLTGLDRLDTELVVQRGGLRWRLNPRDYAHRDLLWLGVKDRWELWHIRRRLAPGAVILDVGANFGYYGIYLAQSLQRRCTVHCLEPHPETFARLQDNIRLNHLEEVVHPHRLALAEAPGRARLSENPDNSGAACLATGACSGPETEIDTLDRFCARLGLERLDFLKIDVEGCEERLLAGGLASLRRWRPLISIEVNPPALAAAGSSPRRVAAWLAALDYRLMLPRRERLEPLRRLPAGPDYLNLICLPPRQGLG